MEQPKNKKILGASLGTCVHVAGIYNFLKLAAEENYQTIFLGPAISPENLVIAIKEHQPDLVAVSYRLTPETAKFLFKELKEEIDKNKIVNIKFIFGGTEPVAKVAEQFNIFEKIFYGRESIEEIRNYLKGISLKESNVIYANNLVDRIKQTYPYPLIRHHFGRPNLEETIEGSKLIAEAKVLDVLSIAPDQNAQEHFFQPELMNHTQNGAGGVPLRKPDDLESIYKVTRCGNYPLLRCYAGTRNLIKWADMCVRTINIAWGAIPLCWYSVLDGRSNRPIEDAIKENQETIKWYAKRKIPVEVNESHQWSLRYASDSLAVAMAFIAAYNAKKLGVRYYVSQYMFNTPSGISPIMDLAKMLAKDELINSLVDENFTVFRQVRAGLSSLSTDFSIAKGQLSASTVLSLAMKPHILHVVGFSEADHAITAEELIESCKIVHGVLKNSLYSFPDLKLDPTVVARKEELIKEAKVLLEAIKNTGKGISEDPLCDYKVLSLSITKGLLDAPHLQGNKFARGDIKTKIINGKCCIVDENGKIISESERIKGYFF